MKRSAAPVLVLCLALAGWAGVQWGWPYYRRSVRTPEQERRDAWNEAYAAVRASLGLGFGISRPLGRSETWVFVDKRSLEDLGSSPILRLRAAGSAGNWIRRASIRTGSGKPDLELPLRESRTESGLQLTLELDRPVRRAMATFRLVLEHSVWPAQGVDVALMNGRTTAFETHLPAEWTDEACRSLGERLMRDRVPSYAVPLSETQIQIRPSRPFEPVALGWQAYLPQGCHSCSHFAEQVRMKDGQWESLGAWDWPSELHALPGGKVWAIDGRDSQVSSLDAFGHLSPTALKGWDEVCYGGNCSRGQLLYPQGDKVLIFRTNNQEHADSRRYTLKDGTLKLETAVAEWNDAARQYTVGDFAPLEEADRRRWLARVPRTEADLLLRGFLDRP